MGIWEMFIQFFVRFLMLIYQFTEMVGIPSLALTICIFAIIIRIVLFPLSLKQAKSTKNIQALQPRITSIQTRFKGNNEKISQETMALYKKYKINPMGGCLPVLAQFPVMIALFQSIRSLFDTNQLEGINVSFFWINDLAQPDLWALPIFVAITTFISSKYSMANTPKTGDSNAKSMEYSMLYVMPLMMGWFARSYPAGLSIYWSAYSVLSIIQQFVTNRMLKNVQIDLGPEDLLDEKEQKKIEKQANRANRPKKSRIPKGATIKRKTGEKTDYGQPLDFTSKRK